MSCVVIFLFYSVIPAISKVQRPDLQPYVPTHQSPTVDEYEPYRSNTTPQAALQLLQQVEIRQVSARYHFCTPDYRMRERRIGDDMFYYIVRGRVLVTIEGRESWLGAGDCAHFRRGMLHSAQTDPLQPIDVIVLHYTATVFGSLTLPELLKLPDVFSLHSANSVAGPHWSWLLHEACREFAVQPAGWERGLEALVLRLLLHIVREQGSELAVDFATAKMKDLQRLLPALETMRTQLAEPLAVRKLAQHCGLSEEQFRRVFRRALGTSPVQYERRLRMEAACLLLRRTNDTIETIAERVGYAEPSFFAHSFRRIMGVSPGQYRARPL